MNYLFYSGKAIELPGNVKDDYDIFCELSRRLGFEDAYSEGKSSAQWINQFLAESEITDPELFKQTGIYKGKEQMRIGLSDFLLILLTILLKLLPVKLNWLQKIMPKPVFRPYQHIGE